MILIHCIASVSIDTHWFTNTCLQVFVLLLIHSVLLPGVECISSSIFSAELPEGFPNVFRARGLNLCSGLCGDTFLLFLCMNSWISVQM